MKIVILNKCFFTLNHLKRLRKFGDVVEYKNTTTEKMACIRLMDADLCVANGLYSPLTKKIFTASPKLKLIVLNSTGFDSIDVVAARKYNIHVANTPNFSTEAVAEHTIVLMFLLIRKVHLQQKATQRIFFEIDPSNKQHERYLGGELRGKTIGIIGLGSIGTRVAELAEGIGMKVVAHTHSRKHVKKHTTIVPLKDLFSVSDIVSLHVPLTKDTIHMISSKEFLQMKPSAIIVNTSRGKILDERALYSALVKKRIAGAGLDVLEMQSMSNNLAKLPNVICTPHAAWWTEEALTRQAETITKTIEAFMHNTPIHIVN